MDLTYNATTSSIHPSRSILGISSTFNNGKQKARRVLLLKSKGVDCMISHRGWHHLKTATKMSSEEHSG